MHVDMKNRLGWTMALTAILLVAGVREAQAQMGGMGRSLGGFGGETISSSYANAPGSAWIPYAGNFGGFVPYSSGGLGVTSRGFRPLRSTLSVGGFSTPTLSRSVAGSMGMAGRSSRRTIMPMSSGMNNASSKGMGMSSTRGPLTKRLGSPFAVPPSFQGSGGMGMP